MVVSYKPKSELLRKYIYQFNTFQKDAHLRIHYLAFPQLGSTLFFLNKAAVSRSTAQLTIQPDEATGPAIEVLGKYTTPITLSYGGYVDELSIDFTPLGINYFFDTPFAHLAPHHAQPLTEKSWCDFALELYTSDNMPERLENLELFLQRQFRNRQLHTLQQAVDLLMNTAVDISVKEAGAMAGLTEKTLLRNFSKYAGCSPLMFRRIVRFRNSIKVKQLNKYVSNLTQLGHESQFYDASHFGREYRLLTGRCPKAFFRSISFVGDNHYPYLFS